MHEVGTLCLYKKIHLVAEQEYPFLPCHKAL